MSSPDFVSPRVGPTGSEPEDPRIGSLLGSMLEGGTPDLVLIGFPSDEGIRRNHGRPGAAEAPDEIRRAFFHWTPPAGDLRFREILFRTLDCGNLVMTGNLEADQVRLGRAVAPYLAQGSIVAILGGGHETSFGHFLGYVEADSPVDVVNWDAHPDVRAMRAGLGHSGSPFRQMLDHPSRGCRSYSVLGILDHSCSEAHLDLIRNRGGRVVRNADLGIDSGKEILMGLQGPVMVSFDLDAVDQAYSPGVSAPATGGLSSRDWLQYVRDSGACAAVSSVDFVEVSPALDRDRQTSRLAAAGLWNFLVGLSRR